jgi:hypothetical protein
VSSSINYLKKREEDFKHLKKTQKLFEKLKKILKIKNQVGTKVK